MPITIKKAMENNFMYIVQKLRIFQDHLKWFYKTSHFLHYFRYILKLIYQIVLFLLLQFSYSKYSPTSHDLSHSKSHLLGLQRNPISHLPFSINSLHSCLHLSLFQRILLLKTLEFNFHLKIP